MKNTSSNKVILQAIDYDDAKRTKCISFYTKSTKGKWYFDCKDYDYDVKEFEEQRRLSSKNSEGGNVRIEIPKEGEPLQIIDGKINLNLQITGELEKLLSNGTEVTANLGPSNITFQSNNTVGWAVFNLQFKLKTNNKNA